MEKLMALVGYPHKDSPENKYLKDITRELQP